eukprot:CAMPEP_0116847832 /NCGR_PEP_ID=MMETSP0418-20121206/14649_1 /TAXON_ID=1158023 /ORGANISM="Astrosyne radiata, Strain 13vi08-1A" /LENGTH=52 /DNA_ID=CAMNT_0004479313 /DNA_START=40 /DNA_END=198 /DNA_ORIENTATION=-
MSSIRNHYREKLVEIDGSASPEEVTFHVLKSLEENARIIPNKKKRTTTSFFA